MHKKFKMYPIDMALYFKWEDYTHSVKNAVFNKIWSERDGLINYNYCQDRLKFKEKIDSASYLLEEKDYENECEEIQNILQTTDYKYMEASAWDEYSAVESLFKLVKLKLTFTENTLVVRKKLRKLLADLGYQKRSSKLVDRMRDSCEALGISTYLSGGRKCDVGKVNIDDWISFRLTERRRFN